MKSEIQECGPVSFPPFLGERVYMREFTKRDGLPVDLTRWQPTIDAMLDGVTTEGPIFLMVDQGFVNAGNTHRRPGPHVDGRWITGIQAHGQPRPHHSPLPEPCPAPPIPYPRHSMSGGSHGHRFNGASELLVFASDVLGCHAYVGNYEGIPSSDGDCSHVDVRGMATIDMKPGIVWAGDALTLIHESIPVRYDCLRTMVRLNVPTAEGAWPSPSR